MIFEWYKKYTWKMLWLKLLIYISDPVEKHAWQFLLSLNLRWWCICIILPYMHHFTLTMPLWRVRIMAIILSEWNCRRDDEQIIAGIDPSSCSFLETENISTLRRSMYLTSFLMDDRDVLSYIVNIIATNDLVTQGARSASMILTCISWYITPVATEVLIIEVFTFDV